MLWRKKSLQGSAVFGRSRGVKLKAFKARFNGFTENDCKGKSYKGRARSPLIFKLIFGGVLIE